MVIPSDTQRQVLQRMADACGTVRRLNGGFWVSGGPVGADPREDFQQSYANFDGWCDIRTVRAMEKRGWVERTNKFPEEWRDVRRISEAGRKALEEAVARKALGWR